MMSNPPARAHAATGNNDRATADSIDGHRLFDTFTNVQIGQKRFESVAVCLINKFRIFLIKRIYKLVVNIGYRAGHGAIDKNFPAL